MRIRTSLICYKSKLHEWPPRFGHEVDGSELKPPHAGTAECLRWASQGPAAFLTNLNPHRQIAKLAFAIPYKPPRLRHHLLLPNFAWSGQRSLTQVIQNTVGRKGSDSRCGNTESARGCKVETGKSFSTKTFSVIIFIFCWVRNVKCTYASQLTLNSQIVLLNWKAHGGPWSGFKTDLTLKMKRQTSNKKSLICKSTT